MLFSFPSPAPQRTPDKERELPANRSLNHGLLSVRSFGIFVANRPVKVGHLRRRPGLEHVPRAARFEPLRLFVIGVQDRVSNVWL